MADALNGSCLCGACTFTASLTDQGAGACHCGQCRKWSGGIYMSVGCTDVTFNDDAPLGSYKASEWGERVFCKTCGSSIMWQTQDGAHQHVSIQTFDDPGQFEIGVEVFIDRKPSNYALSNQTKTMTEAEVFAMFMPDV
ncbi:GFA family protein [Yoonia sp. SS1-5]|uniref:GFA family protein n=1 Tax=Yoonia rhodophyticola TaxID=3137370 RepID=A0AAN0NJ75_9RHOB